MLVGQPPFVADNQIDTYHKIMRGKYKIPQNFPKAAKDMISKLLCHNPAARLGTWKGGAKDVINHEFFTPINWQELESRKVAVPYVPTIKDPLDTSNFDNCPISNDAAQPSSAAPLRAPLEGGGRGGAGTGVAGGAAAGALRRARVRPQRRVAPLPGEGRTIFGLYTVFVFAWPWLSAGWLAAVVMRGATAVAMGAARRSPGAQSTGASASDRDPHRRRVVAEIGQLGRGETPLRPRFDRTLCIARAARATTWSALDRRHSCRVRADLVVGGRRA
eukprot:7389190-Prymnesium_polylepis.1